MAKLVVIVPTLGRSWLLPKLLSHLERQQRLPDEVIVSAPDATHVSGCEGRAFPVMTVFGKIGSSAQRNTALEHALDRFDIVTFFDDDFIPADDYLKRAVAAFDENPGWTVVMGHVVRDGARTKGMTWEEGIDALRHLTGVAAEDEAPRDHIGAYGCNMSIRAAAVGGLRFDERLPLYGWQEDIDFTSRLRRTGRVVGLAAMRGVHLGMKAGKVSGTRFGYSQIINPLYLIRKGSVPASFALPLMVRNFLANLLRSAWPESHIDRRGRLNGNLLAFSHALTGRIEPEFILRIDK